MIVDCNDLTFGYDDTTVFEHITVSMAEGDRVGLIGANGCGKTTFLRVLTGELIASGGTVAVGRHAQVGLLKQNGQLTGDSTVWASMQQAFAQVEKAEEEMRRIEDKLATVAEDSVEYRQMAARHDQLDKYIVSRDGYQRDVRIKTVLNGMGFAGRYDRVVDTLSGGEKTRLALCRLLLDDKDLLVLDEPTNHLDTETLTWLEGYLGGYKGSLLIVSHDRYFLDKTVTKIWDMDGKTIHEYRGNYSKAKQLKQEALYAQERLYAKQQAQVEAMLDYAQRNIARATTSKSAKSRLHRLANMELVDKPITYTKPPVFRFDIATESNPHVLTVDGLPLSVGGKTLIDNVSFEVERGDKIAIVGTNGVGKSTLLKTLLGLINAPTNGYNPLPEPMPSACPVGASKSRHVDRHIHYGANLTIGYYDQETLNLDGGNTVLEELWYRFPSMTQTYARSVLAQLLLTAEDIDKRVDSLSGGERAKLAMAVMVCEKSNLMLLDEPTNHLDLAGREGLEQGLAQYPGTVLFVSHDRYFACAVANKVLELTHDGCRMYKGNYDSYLAAKAREQAASTAPAIAAQEPPKPTKGNYRSKQERRQDAQRKETIARLEKQIAEVEAQIEHWTSLLCSGGDYKQILEYDRELQQAQQLEQQLYEQLAQWDE